MGVSNTGLNFQKNKITLSVTKFRELRDLIYEKSGIFFPEGKLYLLESRLSRRLRELSCNSFEEYVPYIKRHTNQNEELSKIFNLITINETYFFRYQKQLNAFSQYLLPALLKKRQNDRRRDIRIWSAASSSGEEVYTLAILIKEHLNGLLPSWNIDLLGTDISRKMLARARKGAYGKNSFRGEMKYFMKSKYFSLNGDSSIIKDELKKLTRFDYLNLNDIRKMRMLRGVDFIFCRNVLIYFDETMKKKVVRGLYDVLNHGGYLFLGEAESLHGISSAFKVEHFPGAFVYKKE